jgi:hypothetical protein
VSDEPIIAKGELLGGLLSQPVSAPQTRSPSQGLSDAHKALLIRTADHLQRMYHVTDERIIAAEFLMCVGIADENLSSALEKWLPHIREVLISRIKKAR